MYTFINKVWDVGDFKPILTTNDKIHHRMVMKEHRIPQSNFHNTVHDGCHRNLTGTIPESLGNCTNLKVIYFSLNSLRGQIPVTLSSLLLLEEFLLSDNNIYGEIPSYIGNFSRLKQIELDNNKFSGDKSKWKKILSSQDQGPRCHQP